MRARHVLAVIPLGFTLGTFASCASHTCVDDHSCLSPDDAGPGDATFEATAPPDGGDASVPGEADAGSGCDTTKGPSTDPCVVDERFGVFVAPGGSDTDGLGTRAAPVKTIGKAVALAASKGVPRVYACSGEYAEALVLTGSAPLSLYGGLTCPGDAGPAWALAPHALATVHPPSGSALHVDTFTAALHIEDFAFTANDVTAPGESSLAAFVAASPSVSFTRVTFTAGKALTPAADGATPTVALPVALKGIDGADLVDAGAGVARTVTCACPNGVASAGGAGGVDGGAGSNGEPPLGGGAGGTTTNGCTTGQGYDGITGQTASVSSSPASLGSVAAMSWVPSAGNAGRMGGTGQGGGGGISLVGRDLIAGIGGGGGCGGCGGAGATGGQGGGASLALVAFQSTLSLQACALVASDAANGGKGAAGQAGAAGGTSGQAAGGGCNGGNGGGGGQGAPSGGGAGGVSAGILSTGPAPAVDAATTFTLGKAGLGGQGGTAGNAGLDGVARETLAL